MRVRVGQIVDGDPIVRLAGGAAQELPGQLGLGRERPVQEAEGEPARFQALVAQQAVGDGQERPGRIVAGRAPEAAGDRADERTADAIGRAEPRRHEMLTGVVGRVGQGLEALVQTIDEGRGVVAPLGQLGPQRARRLEARGHEGLRSLGRRADGGLHHRHGQGAVVSTSR